jgi:hypothetical protein
VEPDRVESLARAFAAIGTQLHGPDPRPLLDLSVEQVPGCDWASMTTIEDGRGRTMAATDAEAARVDAVQHRLGVGPCMQAARRTTYHTIANLATDRRWPTLAKAIADTSPVRSVLAVHMLEDDPTSLNLYSAAPDGFDRRSAAIAAIIAGQAATMLTSPKPAQSMRQLSEALDTRDHINRAVQILAAETDLSSDDALLALFEASRQLRRTLKSVADYVNEHRDLPPGR